MQPVFQRLRDVFNAGRDPLTLSEDPAGIAPERALVLEVAGSVDRLYEAIHRVTGLEYLGDEEMEFDADEDFAVPDTRKGQEGQIRDDKPVGGRLYLAMPDTTALRELVRLWDLYQAGQPPPYGFGPWFDVFGRLHGLRAWGPSDRIPEETLPTLITNSQSGPIPLYGSRSNSSVIRATNGEAGPVPVSTRLSAPLTAK